MYIKNHLGLIEGTESMLAQKHRLNQIANNLANVDTNGYKKESVTFWEMLYNATDDRQRVGKAMKIVTDHSQGSLDATGNNLDVAITGEGFFKIQTPEGIRYSRNGNFTVNGAGQLSTMDGNLVMGAGGAIALENDKVQIDQSGMISANGENINQLSVVSFANPNDLAKTGNNLFRIKNEEAQEQAVENPSLQQGFLEGSNVTTSLEMIEMIDLQRAYQTQQKVIQTIDDLNGQTISKVGKLT